MAIIQNSKNMAINPMEIDKIPKKQNNSIIQKSDIVKILEGHKQELIEQMNQIVQQERDQYSKEQKNEDNYKIAISLDEDENFIHIILNWINWNELQYAIGNPNSEVGFQNELLKKLVNQIREMVQKELSNHLSDPQEEMSI